MENKDATMIYSAVSEHTDQKGLYTQFTTTVNEIQHEVYFVPDL